MASNSKKVFIKKLILNILYYKFIEKSPIFFSENILFCDTGDLKMRSIGPSFPSFIQLSFFYYTNFSSVNGV